jgi:hypothetical protein
MFDSYQYASGWSKLNNKHTLASSAGRLVRPSLFPHAFLLLTVAIFFVSSGLCDEGSGHVS